MTTRYVIALHGGAGTIAPSDAARERPYHDGLRAALAAGRSVLERGGGALDAVVAAVVALEDCPLFNAGHGAVYTSDERHELDAGVMDGRTLAAGAVTVVRTIRNPVLAARAVLDDGNHVLLAGEGAERFARDHGLAMVDPSYFATPHRLAQLRALQGQGGTALDHDVKAGDGAGFGTVGAVALDRDGHLAAATSTGGMTNKRPGRVGDTPIVGAGVYANDATCAVSTTGTGEHFVRGCVSHDVHARMRYLGLGVEQAAAEAVGQSLEPIGGRGGLIAVGRDGALAMPFNSGGMYRAWVREGEAPSSAIFA
jgi:beta-aspartyl-peptidase (threonine type)